MMMQSIDSQMAPASPARRMHQPRAAAGYPLVGHHAVTSPLAWRRDRAHSVHEFLCAAISLAAQLPRKHFAINLCRDRYHFAVGFAAALIARQISLLPTCRAAEPLQQLARQYPGAYVLTDHDEGDIPIPRFSLLREMEQGVGPKDVPVIPADQIAAIAFTSGSSGFPQAHAKSWGSLVMGARALGQQFGLTQSSSRVAVGTVPAQHMYGLETTIMLPLQWGWSLHAGTSILPADLRADLEQLESPAWLMTTPFHLKAFLRERTNLRGLEGIISATMPLDRSIALSAERLWHVPVHEIYGCTEGGMLASRRTTAGEAWTLCHDLRMRHAEDTTWVMGGHVGAWLQLSDRITLRSQREFLLLGPHRDLVKVAGKRASLTALNAILNRIPGVVDGTFYWPDPGQTGTGRLRAFVVAPGMTRAAILAELRKRIDPVFLPRPLYVVDQLPRNTTGKLPHEHLKTFARHIMHPQQHVHE
ncbi:MAG TPA: AMP-binding protein [Nitrospira sp.]|nr:AMP-binding protein [Nitrospira sp.]